MSDQHVLGKVKERGDCKAHDSQLGILDALPLQLPLGKACFHVAGVDERPVQGDIILQEPALPSPTGPLMETRSQPLQAQAAWGGNTCLPVALEGAEAAYGHLAGPALLGGRSPAHFAQHHQLRQRVALQAGFCQLVQQHTLSPLALEGFSAQSQCIVLQSSSCDYQPSAEDFVLD